MALIDERFERGFEKMAAIRAEMRAGFADMRAEISGVRGDLSGVRADISAVRADLSATQRQMIQIVAGLAIALLGVLTAAIAAGLAQGGELAAACRGASGNAVGERGPAVFAAVTEETGRLLGAQTSNLMCLSWKAVRAALFGHDGLESHACADRCGPRGAHPGGTRPPGGLSRVDLHWRRGSRSHPHPEGSPLEHLPIPDGASPGLPAPLGAASLWSRQRSPTPPSPRPRADLRRPRYREYPP